MILHNKKNHSFSRGCFEISQNGKSNFKTKKQAHSLWLAACSLWDMLNSNDKR
jgi:hypothetical protein